MHITSLFVLCALFFTTPTSPASNFLAVQDEMQDHLIEAVWLLEYNKNPGAYRSHSSWSVATRTGLITSIRKDWSAARPNVEEYTVVYEIPVTKDRDVVDIDPIMTVLSVFDQKTQEMTLIPVVEDWSTLENPEAITVYGLPFERPKGLSIMQDFKAGTTVVVWYVKK